MLAWLVLLASLIVPVGFILLASFAARRYPQFFRKWFPGNIFTPDLFPYRQRISVADDTNAGQLQRTTPSFQYGPGDSVIVTLEPATVRSGLPVTQQHVRSARNAFKKAIRGTEGFMTKIATAYLENAQQVALKSKGATSSLPLRQEEESRACSPLYLAVLLMELVKATGSEELKAQIRRALGISELDDLDLSNGMPTSSQYREMLNTILKFTAVAVGAKVEMEESKTESLRLIYKEETKRRGTWWGFLGHDSTVVTQCPLFSDWEDMYKPSDLFSITFWFNRQGPEGDSPLPDSPTQFTFSGKKDVVETVKEHLVGSYSSSRGAEKRKPVRTIEPMVGELKEDNSGQGLVFLATDFVCSLGDTSHIPRSRYSALKTYYPTFHYNTPRHGTQECFMLPLEQGNSLFYITVGEGDLLPGYYPAPDNIYDTNTALCIEVPFSSGHDMDKWPLYGFRFVLRILMPTKSDWYKYPASRIVDILMKWDQVKSGANDKKKKRTEGKKQQQQPPTPGEVWSFAEPRTIIMPKIDLALPAEDISKVLAKCQLSECFAASKANFTPLLQQKTAPAPAPEPATISVKTEASPPPGKMYLSSVGQLSRVAIVPSPFGEQPTSADWTARLKDTDTQVRISETFYFGIFCQPVYDKSKPSPPKESIPLQIGYIVQ